MIRPMNATLSKTVAALVFGAGLGPCLGAAQTGTIQWLVTDKEGRLVTNVVALMEPAIRVVARTCAALNFMLRRLRA
jgi:hypothetical protein